MFFPSDAQLDDQVIAKLKRDDALDLTVISHEYILQELAIEK